MSPYGRTPFHTPHHFPPRWVAATLALSACLALTACGGGSDDDTDAGDETAAEASDKYVGLWTSGCFPSGAISTQWQWDLKKNGAQTVSGLYVRKTYNNTSCAGTPGNIKNVDIAFVIEGNGTASGKLVDKVNLTPAFGGLGSQNKHLFTVEGTVLYSSASISPSNDADGYPSQLDLGRPYAR